MTIYGSISFIDFKTHLDQSRNCIEKPIIHLKIIGGACIFRYTLAFLKIKPVCRLSNKIRLSDTLLANMKIEE